MNDYDAAIAAENAADAALRAAAQDFASAVKANSMLVANWGDGEGGYALELVRDALISEGVFKPQERSSASIRRKEISAIVRKEVFERDAYRCVICGTHLALTIDHKMPVSRGGSNDINNLQTMCMPCNASKGAKVAA